MKRICIVFFAGLLMVLAGCKKEESRARDPFSYTIKLPEIPDSITTSQQHADWLATHYWQNMDFADKSLTTDSLFMEHSFADFTANLSAASENAAAKGIAILLDAARKDSQQAYAYLLEMAENYLYSPDSPYYDERTYRLFLNYRMQHGENNIRMRHLLDEIAQNAPGTKAPDIQITLLNGTTTTLLQSDSKNAGAMILLFFYQPDCDLCHADIEKLRNDAKIEDAIEAGMLRVVMLYTGDDIESWKRDGANLPQNWTIARDTGQKIEEDNLYIIKAIPSFYLIDASGEIMVKDTSLDNLFNSLPL